MCFFSLSRTPGTEPLAQQDLVRALLVALEAVRLHQTLLEVQILALVVCDGIASLLLSLVSSGDHGAFSDYSLITVESRKQITNSS